MEKDRYKIRKKVCHGSGLKKRQKLRQAHFCRLLALVVRSVQSNENEVYTNKEVGDFYNGKFVSFRIQTDKTERDNDAVKLN